MEQMGLFVIGFVLIMLGSTNMKGDISSVHWYNRTRVRPEDCTKYGRLVGVGTVITGATLICVGLLSFVVKSELAELLILPGLAVGLILILYAQFKYNKGIF